MIARIIFFAHVLLISANTFAQNRNLVVNGDFSHGNARFTSQYAYTTYNIGEGEYFVGSRPLRWNNLLADCRDHTTGDGNMLLVNGTTRSNVAIWTQTITVHPNTQYELSAWLQNANVHRLGSNPPTLQFVINGSIIGNGVQVSYASNVWQQMTGVWNSGNTTTARIAIFNRNTLAPGNDFAIDDITFVPQEIQRDRLVKKAVKPVVKQHRISLIATTNPVHLNKANALTWLWKPATRSPNTIISNPAPVPQSNIAFVVPVDTAAFTLEPEAAIITSNKRSGSTPKTVAVGTFLSIGWMPMFLTRKLFRPKQPKTDTETNGE